MIVPEHRKNLETLADYLESLPEDYEQFDMIWFCTKGEDRSLPNIEPIYSAGALKHDCGTAACALGHGPAAGIITKLDYWEYYCENFVDYNDCPAWHFLFDARWDKVDNTHQGAAKRIRRYLETNGDCLEESANFLDIAY